MATPKIWKNVKVSMQSAIAAAVPVTAMTAANPAVCTNTGTAPTTGAYVLISMPSVSQLDGRVVRVTNITTTSFSLDGIDSTLFDTFAAPASVQVLTMGVSITSATTISASGGDFSFIDTTTIHANLKSQIPGLPNAASYSIDHIEDASDVGQIALTTANQLQAQRAFKVLFQNGSFFLFNAYVGFSGLPAGQAQALVTTPSVLTINSQITKYAS